MEVVNFQRFPVMAEVDITLSQCFKAISTHVQSYKDENSRLKRQLVLLREENEDLRKQISTFRSIREKAPINGDNVLDKEAAEHILSVNVGTSDFKSPGLSSTPSIIASRKHSSSVQPRINFKGNSTGIDLLKRKANLKEDDTIEFSYKPSPIAKLEHFKKLGNRSISNFYEEPVQLFKHESNRTRENAGIVDEIDDLADTRQLSPNGFGDCDDLADTRLTNTSELDDTKQLTQNSACLSSDEEENGECESNDAGNNRETVSSSLGVTQALDLLDDTTEGMEIEEHSENRKPKMDQIGRVSPVIGAKTGHQLENLKQTDLETSYDCLPQWHKGKNNQPCVEVVRKKADRRHYHGIDCAECHAYYEAVGGEHKEVSSRHRTNQQLPDTPDGFWDLSWREKDDQNPSAPSPTAKGIVVKKIAQGRRKYGLKVPDNMRKATLKKTIRLSQSPAI